MSHDQALREIAATLATLPYVAVEDITLPPAKPSITFTVAHLDSLGVVVYSADGANLPMHLWTVAPGRPISERATGKHIRYRLSAVELDSAMAMDRFIVFGCYLAWYLYDAALLPKAAANALLEKWDGAPV